VIRALALIAILLAPSMASADLGGFSIDRFDVEVDVHENSNITVVERIEIQFREPRRGIYREIPIRYTDPTGFQYGYDFRLLGVEDENGNARQTKVSRDGAMVRVRIGDPDRRVTGTQVYYVRYRATDVLRQFGEHDELYWNVTGHQWNTTIGAATLRVNLPEAVTMEDLRVKGWAGRYGSRQENVITAFPQPGEVNVASQVQLDPREGLTVAIAWPSGIVSFPGTAAKVWRFVSMNLVVLLPVLWLVLLIRRYRSHGIDPSIPAANMVRYEPPPGVSAGAIGTLVDEKVDMIDITATIVDLAVRGYLTIETVVEEKFFGLKKDEVTSFRRDPNQSIADLLPHERQVLDGLFDADPAHVSTEDLKEEFYKKIPGITSALYDRLVDLKFVAGNPQTVRRQTVGLGIAAGVLTFVAGALWASFMGGWFPVAAVLPVICGVVTIAMFSAFAPAMPRRTRDGVRIASWAKGFEEFVDRVESDRFERAAARDVYEQLLPYAMALGVATKWSRKFEGIYDEESPGWYAGPHGPGRGFSTVIFHSNLNDAMSSASESMASRPRSSGSSGSGGGGFSGGGGGGGGGGSW
jgi:uncharacterized membrane protein YgcG